MTSARFAMFLTRSSPRSDLRLTVMDFLLALNNRKYQESWFGLWLGLDCRPNKERPASPPCGFSTLTTSAPSQASASVQDGPASNWVRSRTRTPARQPSSAPLVAIFVPPARSLRRHCHANGVLIQQGAITAASEGGPDICARNTEPPSLGGYTWLHPNVSLRRPIFHRGRRPYMAQSVISLLRSKRPLLEQKQTSSTKKRTTRIYVCRLTA